MRFFPFSHRSDRRVDTVRMRIARGEVADILPADFVPARDLEADKSEITRIITAWAETGGVDRATGGHLLDPLIDAWSDQEITAVRTQFANLEATSDRLIGAAESTHRDALDRLGTAADNYSRHLDVYHRARIELVGHLDAAPAPHRELLDTAQARTATHADTCVTDTPDWTPPWRTPPTPNPTGTDTHPGPDPDPPSANH